MKDKRGEQTTPADEAPLEEDLSIDGPYESAFDALFEPKEAANLKVRSKLMNRLIAYVEGEGLTQGEAAERLGTGQPRISELMDGKIDRFTIDALLNMCTAAGIEVEVRFPDSQAAAK